MSNDQYNLNGYQLVRALYYFTADFRWISDARVGIDRATSQPANEPTSQPTYQQHQLIASATVWKIVMSFPIGYAISYLIYCLEEKVNESIGESLEVVDTLPALGSYPQLCLSIVDCRYRVLRRARNVDEQRNCSIYPRRYRMPSLPSQHHLL